MPALLIAAWSGSGLAGAEPDSPGPVPETFGEQVDRFHASLYEFLQRQVECVDHWFVRKDREPLPVPPIELRLGFYGQARLDTANTVTWRTPTDLDAKIHLPNVDRFLKLKVTTRDPTVIPGAPPLEAQKMARVAVERSRMRDFHATLGLKTSVDPRLYGHVDWSPLWVDSHWKFYPFERVYWDSGDGFGEITSFMADRWRDSWNFRTAASIKWSEVKGDVDRQVDNDERGWEWAATLGLNYARELLRESDIGRVLNGADMARATGVQIGFVGEPGHLDEGRVVLLHRGALWSRWVFYVFAPEIEWTRAGNWRRTLVLNIGVDILFWHDRLTRLRAPLASGSGSGDTAVHE